ncbi:MAG: T9SS type A sorting domain-containing protein [Bacteroidia bacterium]|nr:T9SS type A sorting domain-containing protein [Bacteroidia bacterium]
MYKLTGAIALAVVLGGEINAQTYTWSPAGPVLSAGRSRNMVIDRLDNKVLYVGSVSSGIFKSTDSGTSWLPVNDQDTVRNISYLAQSADGTIYASTGEGFLRATAKSRSIPGTGLYKLSGNNLVQVKSSTVTGSVINKIACHPSNASNFAIAGTLGLLITTDGGNTFTQASGAIPATATAMTVYYDNSGNIFATATSSLNSGGYIYSKVYKSVGGGAGDFVDITPSSTELPDMAYGRIELGIANSNNNTIYASVAKSTTTNNISSATLYAFFVSKDAGSNWTLILEGSPQLDPLSNGGSSAAGDYAHCVTVNPYNPDQVFIGSYKFYTWTKTTGGPEGIGTWIRYGNEFAFNSPIYLRQNIHDIKLITSGNDLLATYFVTDAGVYKSSDDLLTFQFFSAGLGTAQYNSVDIMRFPKTAKQTNSLVPYSGYIAATAGNGVSMFSGNYPLVTSELNYLNGDFFNGTYSKLSPNTAFFTAANSNMYVSPDITTGEPTLMQVSHLGSECGSDPSITQIDFRGISNNGSTKDQAYVNNTYTATGTPFKLWENTKVDGSVTDPKRFTTIDSALFFNDSIRVLIPVTSTVAGASSYTISLIKPQASAIIDKVIISTFTISIPLKTSSSCFGNSSIAYTTNTKATMEFGGATSPTLMPSSYTLTGLTSTVVNALNKLTIDPVDLKDIIQFEIPVNPLTPIVTSTANLQYVRVGVTVFYRYNAGSSIEVKNENISVLKFSKTSTISATAWTFTNVGTNSLAPVSTLPLSKYKLDYNARLAILNDKGVLVSKRPLNTNDPQKFQMVSCTGALTTNSGTYTAGQMTVTGLPYLLEWAPNGKAIYYVTSVTTPSPVYRVYKVNVGASIHDFAIDDYRGSYYTGCVDGKRPSTFVFTFTTNFNSPFRTTLTFTCSERITNLAVSDDNKTVLLTTSDASPTTGKKIYVSTPNMDVDNIDNTLVSFTNKTGTGLPNGSTNCALFEMTDNKRVLVGTDRGVYVTDDISVASPTWVDAKNASSTTNALPNVQIFDIKQQKASTWDSYNSGIIYVATNGRGAWLNKNYLVQTVIGVEENNIIAKNTGLSLYPNPTNGNVTLNFFAADNENIVINVMDLSGRVVKSESQKNLSYGYADHTISTNDLSSGVYIVNVTSSKGIKRVSKLVVSK